jgi:Spy/CpxP family protein refolding chaperone
MKKLILMVAVSLLAGVLSFFLMRSQRMAAHHGSLVDSMPELTWIRKELKLTDAQFAKVSALHASYRPKCMEMCRSIADGHEKIEGLARKDRMVTSELEAAIREHADNHARCQQAMLRHIYETAAVLDDSQASRYLETMLPYALDFTHGGLESPHSH